MATRGIWVLHIMPGNYDEPPEFGGVFETITTDLLRQVGHENTRWEVGDEQVAGYNMRWACKNAPQFIFNLEKPGIFLIPRWQGKP